MSGRGAERILDLLEWLSARSEGVSLTETVLALDVPKSSGLLLLRLLTERGYVERSKGGTYTLVRLPGEVRRGSDAWGTLLRVSNVPLRDAVEASNETGFVAVLEGAQIRYLTKCLPSREIRYDRDITHLRQAHLVASGLAILSGFDEAALHAHLEFALPTPEARSDVLAAVARARESGCAVNLKGVVEGAAGIAAPIRDADGRIVAAINISGPRERIVAHVSELTDITIRTAQRVSEELARRSRIKPASKGGNDA
ncbi:IclR family transcriptional regulator [Aureimonas sp. AU40]|uniref:IclR family transcriptional regulator n=1 Tax=Aureimonas sp. AU40 TaxID=1637747 RepID=UPI0009EA4479|nr:IclR family transcriptional regulator C-terminal domain-containing protein [Aureimonas sp. AU40]